MACRGLLTGGAWHHCQTMVCLTSVRLWSMDHRRSRFGLLDMRLLPQWGRRVHPPADSVCRRRSAHTSMPRSDETVQAGGWPGEPFSPRLDVIESRHCGLVPRSNFICRLSREPLTGPARQTQSKLGCAPPASSSGPRTEITIPSASEPSLARRGATAPATHNPLRVKDRKHIFFSFVLAQRELPNTCRVFRSLERFGYPCWLPSPGPHSNKPDHAWKLEIPGRCSCFGESAVIGAMLLTNQHESCGL
jgi:hypothetical protein